MPSGPERHGAPPIIQFVPGRPCRLGLKARAHACDRQGQLRARGNLQLLDLAFGTRARRVYQTADHGRLGYGFVQESRAAWGQSQRSSKRGRASKQHSRIVEITRKPTYSAGGAQHPAQQAPNDAQQGCPTHPPYTPPGVGRAGGAVGRPARARCVEGTIPRHQRAVLTARHLARAERTPGTGCNGAPPKRLVPVG
jgi:hypothetical protein